MTNTLYDSANADFVEAIKMEWVKMELATYPRQNILVQKAWT